MWPWNEKYISAGRRPSSNCPPRRSASSTSRIGRYQPFISRRSIWKLVRRYSSSRIIGIGLVRRKVVDPRRGIMVAIILSQRS